MDVVFVLADGRQVIVQMVLDTGYVGTLTLPSKVIRQFGLPFLRNMVAKLADGTSIDVDIHEANILWHGFEQGAEVIILDDRPLLGMLMLDGSSMSVDFVNDGPMILNELG